MTVDRAPRRPQTPDTFDTVTGHRDVIEVDTVAPNRLLDEAAYVWVETLSIDDDDEGLGSYVAHLDAQDLDDLISNLTDARTRLRELAA